MARTKFILHPVGSAGDVYPFVGLGMALKSRGHDVTILTSEYFRDVVEQSDLEFVNSLPRADFLKLIDNPNLWNPVRGAGTILQSMTPELLDRCYRAIADRYVPEQTVLLAPVIGFAARLALSLIHI